MGIIHDYSPRLALLRSIWGNKPWTKKKRHRTPIIILSVPLAKRVTAANRTPDTPRYCIMFPFFNAHFRYTLRWTFRPFVCASGNSAGCIKRRLGLLRFPWCSFVPAFNFHLFLCSSRPMRLARGAINLQLFICAQPAPVNVIVEVQTVYCVAAWARRCLMAWRHSPLLAFAGASMRAPTLARLTGWLLLSFFRILLNRWFDWYRVAQFTVHTFHITLRINLSEGLASFFVLIFSSKAAGL